MLTNIPLSKLKKTLKKRFNKSSLSTVKLYGMIWLNFLMFLKRLAIAAADQAKEDRSAVIREHHVRAAAKIIMKGIKG